MSAIECVVSQYPDIQPHVSKLIDDLNALHVSPDAQERFLTKAQRIDLDTWAHQLACEPFCRQQMLLSAVQRRLNPPTPRA